MKKWVIGAVIVAPMVFFGCTWVKPSSESQTIRLVKAAEPTCEKLGSVTVSVASAVGPFQRDDQDVQKNLTTLARNAAAADYKKADTIAPFSEAEQGKQTFGVYRCIKP